MFIYIFSLLAFVTAQQQEETVKTPWWGWILAILALAAFIWLVIDNYRKDKQQKELDQAAARMKEISASTQIDEKQALATQISGLELEQAAEELLRERGKVESVDLIETDLDGVEGPEIVQVIKKEVAEEEGMQVTKTTETVTSFVDGIATDGISETLVVDTDKLDVSRVTQRLSTEGEGIDHQKGIETFAVDSEGLDVIETAETSFDEIQGTGVVNMTRTVMDEEKGIGFVDKMQAVVEPDEEVGEIAEEELEQAVEASKSYPEKVQAVDWAAATEAVVPDDLTLVEGIGPKIKSILHDAGVKTFSQLAQMEPSAIKDIIVAAGLRLADTTTWPMQAKLAAEGKLEELKAFQDSLQGGKLV